MISALFLQSNIGFAYLRPYLPLKDGNQLQGCGLFSCYDLNMHITNSITADYKKCSEDLVCKTNTEALSIALGWGIKISKSALVFLSRLINHAKTKIGIIGSADLVRGCLQGIQASSTLLNLWTNSASVVNWFSNFQCK